MSPKILKELQEEYPIFEYESYSINKSAEDLKINFNYSVKSTKDPLNNISLNSEIIFKNIPKDISFITDDKLNNLIFNLGLVDLLSYWKATCSPTIKVTPHSLDPKQINWWKDLIIKGMGEYFYINKIDFTKDNFIDLDAKIESYDKNLLYTEALLDKILIPLGGGRDSALVTKLIQEKRFDFNFMILNEINSAEKLANVFGCNNPIKVIRKIDPKLLELNRHGYLNGHTPFSAFLAFLNAVCLPIYGFKHIMISNEKSSDEGNVTYLGRSINHQYTKSFEFEKSFDEYLQNYLVKGARYFSYVRPYYELKIGEMFSKYSDLLPYFRSCNKKQSENSWCGECPKCLSVYLTTYPFVGKEVAIKIFGKDLFENEQNIQILLELCGLTEHKPFECVTTVNETLAALYLCIKTTPQNAGIVLNYAKEKILNTSIDYEQLVKQILEFKGNTERIPQEYL